MFARKDQSALLKYLSKTNEKQKREEGKAVPKVVPTPEPITKKKAAKMQKEKKEKAVPKVVPKVVPTPELITKKKVAEMQKGKKEKAVPKVVPKVVPTPEPISKKKAAKKQKGKKEKAVPKVVPTPEPITKKKAAKMQKQDDEDKALGLEVLKMFEQFKKEAETGTETVEDIEMDIRENEGFVDDDDDMDGGNGGEGARKSNSVVSKAQQQLAVSMFRSMNEYLYTHTSTESKKDFTENKFKLYHEAYDTLANDWPIKPVDYLIDVLKTKISDAKLSSTTIADIGCGSRPQIAEAFPTATVFSYDLYQNDLTDTRIMSADMCRLPMDSAICDYAVYSLSLMPTNLREALKEANRIIKMNGHLLIVEVSSRFADFQGAGRVQNLPEKHTGQRFAKELKNFGFQLVSNEDLQPNGYFAYFCFKKVESVENVHKNKLPEITLKPCVYKPR